MKQTISFIGAGKMAEALIRGILRSKLAAPSKITASDVDQSRSSRIKKNYKIKTTGNNLAAAKAGDIIVLAVKPQDLKSVIVEIGPEIRNKLVISIAAGIRLEMLENFLLEARVIRAMPNNPCIVGEGISAICRGKTAEAADLKIARKLFEAVGSVVEVGEELMDAVTALSGSGPGFVYYILEAFLEAAKAVGFKDPQAKELVSATFSGSLKTVEETKKGPEELRAMVASPKGTTEAGLKIFEEEKLKEIIARAVISARKRAEELSKEIS